ncbi:hypothetical protein ACFQJD_05330 [Haloplanus sp. GCM10025708]|uniref:hypothetical protein n=1 Tax=Haloferacaceae TaxID=1644056 RepID=UPI00361428A4
MTGNVRLAAAGVCLLLVSGAAFASLGVGAALPTALLGLASLGAVGAAVRFGGSAPASTR